MFSRCPHCHQDIKEENSAYCPSCGRSLRQTVQQRTGLLTAGGFLLIVTSCICLFFGILGLNASFQYPYSHGISVYIGIFGIIGFLLGLSGGVVALKRKVVSLSILGACFTLLFGFIIVIVAGQYPQGYTGGVFSLPIISFSLIALILIGASYKEFS